MAEFQEVMKQARRMCKEYGPTCEDCALYSEDGCLFQDYKTPDNKNLNFLADAEKIVMNWAAKNPEPRYLTWEEWQKKNFPTAHDVMHPCAFMKREEAEKVRGIECGRTSCNVCARSPIPADIAEKLGIKPIGGTER